MEVGDAQANNDRDWNRETAFKQPTTTTVSSSLELGRRREFSHGGESTNTCFARTVQKEEFVKISLSQIQSNFFIISLDIWGA